jgi:manganese/zinc/iron transport system permease protein
MAVMIGLVFLGAVLLAPEQGVIAGMRRRASQAREFAETMLVIHLFNHERSAEESRENRVVHLNEHLAGRPSTPARWSTSRSGTGWSSCARTCWS